MNSDFKYWWFRIVVSVILLMAGVMPVYCAMVGKQEVQGALDILDMEFSTATFICNAVHRRLIRCRMR